MTVVPEEHRRTDASGHLTNTNAGRMIAVERYRMLQRYTRSWSLVGYYYLGARWEAAFRRVNQFTTRLSVALWVIPPETPVTVIG